MLLLWLPLLLLLVVAVVAAVVAAVVVVVVDAALVAPLPECGHRVQLARSTLRQAYVFQYAKVTCVYFDYL